MPSSYRTPGVYVEEISTLPPSVAQVETAIPAFIGYTAKADLNGKNFVNVPVRITSLVDYVLIFGGPFNENGGLGTITLTGAAPSFTLDVAPTAPTIVYRMYYSLQLYFLNGGGPCYIISVDLYTDDPVATPPTIDQALLIEGLVPLAKEDEPTLILFPDAVAIASGSNFYSVYQAALLQCSVLKDRFTICDVYDGNLDFNAPGGSDVINEDDDTADASPGFRSGIGNNNLTYGAVYYPWLTTTLTPAIDEGTLEIDGGPGGLMLKNDDDEELSLFHLQNDVYHEIKDAIAKFNIVMPPSCLMAGIYARVDSTRGVWKAPANVNLGGVIEPTVVIDDEDQEGLNVDTSGKSVNAIRRFTGKGILVWGSRTLAGNDNEWRYIPVRRFFIMVEESVKKATEPFVFEPNDANTWVKIRAMIENFLILQWRAGALAGAKPEDAFFVNVGLGETMTSLDILEGRLIVEIGLAAVRPAEFIILRFSHKVQVS